MFWLLEWLFGNKPLPPPLVPVSIPYYSTDLTFELYNEINSYRRSKKLQEIYLDSFLSRKAQLHSEKMANELQLTHDGLITSVHANAVTMAQVFQKWKDNPVHNASLLGNYSYVGLGMATGKDGNNYYTVVL